MAYYGRICGVGETGQARPALLYGLTGRSEDSKKRIAKIIEDEFIKKVHIGPVGEPTKEQKKKANIYFYDALFTITDIINGWPYAVVSNGVQTGTIADVTCSVPYKQNVVERTLKLFGHERDRLRTPRIAGEIVFHKKQPKSPEKDGLHPDIINRLGIVTEDSIGIYQILYDNLQLDEFKLISTYTGEDDNNPTAPTFERLEDVVNTVSVFLSSTAEELANSFYEWLDEKYRVSAVAAVLTKDGKWDVAVKNLHEAKDS
jgi:IMP cyclohydrolase